MKSGPYMKKCQLFWARSHGIALRSKQGVRGEESYTVSLEKNLFKPLTQDVQCQFQDGAGNELSGKTPSKMQAVHSSSALTVNFFFYWKNLGYFEPVARVLKVPSKNISSIQFEQPLPIMKNPNRRIFRRDPNIDVLFLYNGSRISYSIGIECKFTEPYCNRLDGKERGLKKSYLDVIDLWRDIPSIRNFAETIAPVDDRFRHLHAAQLVKHVLGMKHRFGKRGFRLLYLWYDVPFNEGEQHRSEIEEFKKAAKEDNIVFQTITWQEAIIGLADKYYSTNERYIDYLTQRYL